jgi:hypothetical protein
MREQIKISHNDLCLATAKRFIKKFALYEYKSFASAEEPDVLVFDTGGTVLFEIKVSLADFKKDQKKDARKKYRLNWHIEFWHNRYESEEMKPEIKRQYCRIVKEHPELIYIENKHLGNKRYYVCPYGLIPLEKVPEGWGLLYYKHGKFFLKKESAKFRSNLRTENDLAIHALRRYASGDSTGILVNTYTYRGGK